MDSTESILYHGAIAVSLVATLKVFIWPGGRLFSKATFVLIALLIGSATGLRWAFTGHPPIFGTYEEVLAAVFTLSVSSLLIDGRQRFVRFTLPFILILLLYGTLFDSERRPLVISEQSLWVYFHVLFAWVTFGIYTFSSCAAVKTFIKPRSSLDLDGGDRVVEWLLGEGLVWGLAVQALYFFLGSYYSSWLHGSWWVWDPVEYLFVISWFLYAIAVHGRIFYGWDRRRVSKWVLAAYSVTITLYWALIYVYWSSYHIFDPEIKMHLFMG